MLRAGEGGDDTTAIDAAAEDAVVARLEALEADFLLVSEELGERAFGSGGPTRVVVDPIDGSVNAKRGIPFFSLSLAVADGPTMGDVTFGYVYDFGAREEWVAERGRGARLERPAARRPAAEGPDRDPLVRGDDDRVHRRQGLVAARGRGAPAGDGLARALALPPRRRPGRRGVLAEGGALDRHRGGPAARARARLRDRAVRGSAVRRGAARSRGPLARRRGCDAGALRRDRRGAPGNAEGAACAAPSCSGRSEHLSGSPCSRPPAGCGCGPERLRSRRPAAVRWAGRLSPPASSLLPRTVSARITKPMPLSRSAIPTTSPKSAICSAM